MRCTQALTMPPGEQRERMAQPAHDGARVQRLPLGRPHAGRCRAPAAASAHRGAGAPAERRVMPRSGVASHAGGRSASMRCSTSASCASLSRKYIARDSGSSAPMRIVSEGGSARMNTASSLTSSPKKTAAAARLRRTRAANASPLSGKPSARTLTTHLPPKRRSAGSIPCSSASMQTSAAPASERGGSARRATAPCPRSPPRRQPGRGHGRRSARAACRARGCRRAAAARTDPPRHGCRSRSADRSRAGDARRRRCGR